jgi:hypothetical protein
MTRTVEQVLADQTKEESANELVEHRQRCRTRRTISVIFACGGLKLSTKSEVEATFVAASTIDPSQMARSQARACDDDPASSGGAALRLQEHLPAGVRDFHVTALRGVERLLTSGFGS